MDYQITQANQPLMPAYFQGRWAVKQIADRDVMYSTNLGAEIDFQVTDASFVRLTFLPLAYELPSWVAIQIDGLPFQRQAVTNDPLWLTLDGRPHVVRVVLSGNTDEDRVWDGNQGFTVKDLTTDGELQPVRLGRHSVPWIGDSLTAGCWVMGKNPAEDYRAEANYAAVASDLLNARNVRIAYSAVGLSKPGTGGVPVLPEVLTAVDSKTTWQPVPTDLVVINVGTNDRHTDDTTFTVVLRRFLNQVQTLYPNSRLAVMIPFNQNFAAIIRAVVAEFMQLQLIETATWQLSTTDGVHLDLAGSRMAGELTAQALRTQYPDVFKS
ncbi:endoglucanase [Lactiplantibacillus plantarum]|uniref:SGNH/GDSL hydrolase family protein n=1 Tax=Lactiplantibacillus plantarum TaxID=1590 RepID=UPI00083F5997|nr:SGNH/GDSL hydrolase family protein [Lactiplantibacillus plantarum]AOG32864.1 endoglucanase [Lactiplantibacillus plantarum]MCS6092220.1 endoglucanase [Lactobacillus sp. LMY-20]MDR7675828.1 SGNH/GDSL hydrolase family protein [Lactiplantibacillus plantarum]